MRSIISERKKKERRRNVMKFDLKESRESFCRRGRGRSFHVEGPKTERARKPRVESLVQRIWKLGESEEERKVREGSWAGLLEGT